MLRKLFLLTLGCLSIASKGVAVESPYFTIKQIGSEAPNVAVIYPQDPQSLSDNFWELCYYKFEIVDGVYDVADGGAKMMHAVALTAYSTGKRIKVEWDNTGSTRHHCYIKGILTEP